MINQITITELLQALENSTQLRDCKVEEELNEFAQVLFNKTLRTQLKKSPNEEFEDCRNLGDEGKPLCIMNFGLSFGSLKQLIEDYEGDIIDILFAKNGELSILNNPASVAQILYMAHDDELSEVVRNKCRTLMEYLISSGYDFTRAQIALLRTLDLDSGIFDDKRIYDVAKDIHIYAVNNKYEEIYTLDQQHYNRRGENDFVLTQKLYTLKKNLNKDDYNFYLELQELRDELIQGAVIRFEPDKCVREGM